jgi:type II secretory pathway component GspD/PulD (secretin)
VTILVAGNRLVVTCDDPQVIVLVQELLRGLAPSQQGDFEVIRLVHAKAVDVARVLDETFNGRAGPGKRTERVRIVAELAAMRCWSGPLLSTC